MVVPAAPFAGRAFAVEHSGRLSYPRRQHQKKTADRSGASTGGF